MPWGNVTQQAMNLSPEQRRTLVEETARGFARSAALHRERGGLLCQLDMKMISEDGHSTERVTKVRAAFSSANQHFAVVAMSPRACQKTFPPGA